MASLDHQGAGAVGVGRQLHLGLDTDAGQAAEQGGDVFEGGGSQRLFALDDFGDLAQPGLCLAGVALDAHRLHVAFHRHDADHAILKALHRHEEERQRIALSLVEGAGLLAELHNLPHGDRLAHQRREQGRHFGKGKGLHALDVELARRDAGLQQISGRRRGPLDIHLHVRTRLHGQRGTREGVQRAANGCHALCARAPWRPTRTHPPATVAWWRVEPWADAPGASATQPAEQAAGDAAHGATQGVGRVGDRVRHRVGHGVHRRRQWRAATHTARTDHGSHRGVDAACECRPPC